MEFWAFVSPHFDDAHFGCGGLITSLTEKGGVEPYELVVCATDYERRDGAQVTAQARLGRQQTAAEILGCGSMFLDVGVENELDLCPKAQIIDAISSKLVLGTTHLFVPLPSYNQDHRAVYDACMALVRPNGPWSELQVFAYEVPGQETPGTPGTYRKLAHRHLVKKKEAIRCHGLQANAYPQNADGAEALARGRGSECGALLAEKFWTVRNWL